MTDPAPPPARRLHDILAGWADQRGDAEAMVCGDRRLTYAQLTAAVDDCAAGLIAAGIRPGERVATLAPPGADFLVTFLAAASIGAIWVGLNPRYAEPELDDIVARIAPRLVFARRRIGERAYDGWLSALPDPVVAVALDGAYAEFVGWGSAVPEEERRRRRAAVRPEDSCLIVFTSGSTGIPKGAMISHAALIGASAVQLGIWPADPLRILNNLPINHIGCVGDLSCYALVGGGTIVFSERFDPAVSLRLLRDEAITVWGQVPTQFQLTLDSPGFDPAALGALRRLFWGGAHASRALIDRLRRLCPRVATSYGQTETVGSVTFTPADASLDMLAGTVGRAVEPYAVRVVDDAGRPLPAGENGEIAVKTPFGMSGYWGADPGTPSPWHRTGDVGALDGDGNLRLIGRVHDIFKSGGYNIYPAEIEAALEAHPGVQQASVVGVADDRFGAVAVAFIVPADPKLDPAALGRFLRGRIADYKIPKLFHMRDALPRLPVGKVDKAALRAAAAER